MKKRLIKLLIGLTLGAIANSALAKERATTEPNGSKLWAQNCIRCHNSRPPTTYSDAQWEVVMMHMRIRANLTATEHKAIYEFIKSAH